MRLKLKAHCECDDIIRIGRVVENEVAEVEFDFSQWQEEYGAGIATLLVLRNHDANPYPVVLTIEDGKAVWTITDADTAVFGRGCFQLKYVAGTKVKMSKIFQFTCGKSLTGEGDAPDPYENWLDTLTDLTAETQTNAQAAQASAESASASAQSASQSAGEAEEIRQSIVDNRSDWAEETKTSLKYIDNRPAVRAGTGINAVVEGQVGSGTGKVSASGWYSHAEGYGSSASGYYAHAENQGTASGRASHAENGSTASGRLSHAEGTGTASGETSHAEGSGTQAKGNGSHAEGGQTEVLTATNYAHVEGYGTKAWQSYQHVQGKFNSMGLPMDGSLVPCHVVGCGTDDTHRSNCHTLDFNGNAWYKGNVRINGTPTRDDHLVTKGWVEGQGYLTEQTQSDWYEGDDTSPNYIQNKPSIKSGAGTDSIIEGRNDNIASGQYSHAEGYQTQATASDAHAEGYKTVASKPYSHAEGNTTIASGSYSHAEGSHTTCNGTASHAEGTQTSSNGAYSHAEGANTVAKGSYSHAEGMHTIASRRAQHVQGAFNIEDTEGTTYTNGKYLHIVGNGTDDDNRSNAHTLDWDGNAWYAGKVTAEGTPTESNDLVPKSYADKFLNAFPVDTASGSVASFSDGAELPLKSLTVGIDPVQNLNGYENPWPAGGGKNKCAPFEEATSTIQYRGIYVGDGTFTASSTAPWDASNATVFFLAGNVSSGASSSGNGVRPTVPVTQTAVDGYVTIAWRKVGDVDPTDYQTQIEAGSTATAYAPYSNVCPISGWDECNINANGTPITIDFGQTVYGGKLDVLSGVLKVDKKISVISAISTVSASYIKSDACDGYVLDNDIYPRVSRTEQATQYCDKLKFTTANIFTAVGYPNQFTINQNQIHLNLANSLLGITDHTQETADSAKAKINAYLAENPVTMTIPIEPIEITLDPHEVSSLLGNNTIYCDTGDTSVEYRADPTLYIQKKIAQAISALS